MFLGHNMNDKIHWIEVRFTADGEVAEALADVLGRFVSNGVVIEAITRHNPTTKDHEPTGKVAVVGYLAVNEQLEEKRNQLTEALWHLGQITPLPEPQYKPIKDQNWMEAWKEHYRPFQVGEKILVMPAWEKPKQNEEKLVVRINPAMAFGTGTHPSTQLCLQLVERYIKKGGNFIDVGCGSGILSIAAIRLGTIHALAVDVDNQAVTATRENSAINDLKPGALETGLGSVDEIRSNQFSIQQAPLVAVNILASVILQLFDKGLGDLVSEEGVLLLSGILEPQLEDVLQSAKAAGFSLLEQIFDEDWVSLALKKDTAS